MKTCPVCRQQNAPGNRFCQQCGAVLDVTPNPAAPPADRTLLAQQGLGAQARGRSQTHRTRPVEELFAGGKTSVVIGRSPECDIILPHPTVSRRHAELERTADGRLVLRDLESSNGVFVDGQRLFEPWTVEERSRVGIGPFLFSLDRGLIHSFDSSQGLRLQAVGVEKVVTTPKGDKLKLLDGVNVVVEPGEFVTLLGPSGSGKSTLMDCLNGRRRATGGQVLANGEDFYRHFDSFRQSLGYVPQKDIVHTQLSVYKALYYTAKLRLPRDTTPTELRNRVEDVIREMKLEERRENPIHTLSGGQLKRVSLGAELLARPALLYIDEATSGLDAGTDAEMMHLFRRLADEEGKSVVCITHNVENVESCHLILVLCRGRVVYYGPPDQAPGYFGVKRLSGIYTRLDQDRPEAWHDKFLAHPLHQEYVTKRLQAEPPAPAAAMETVTTLAALSTVPPGLAPIVVAPPEPPGKAPPGKVPRPHHPPVWLQFQLLTQRYADLILADRRSLQLLMLQAPLVGLLLLVGFLGMSFGDKVPQTRELEEHEKQGLLTLQQQMRSRFDEAIQDPRLPDLLGETLSRWKDQKVEWPELAKQTVREKLALPADAEVTAGQAFELARKGRAGEADLTPEQQDALLKAQLVAAMRAGERPWLEVYRKRSFEVPENVRPWVAEQLQRPAADKVAGADVITLREMIKKKEIKKVPPEARKWLADLPQPPGAELEAFEALSKFQQDQVIERLVSAKGPVIPYGKEISNPRNSYILLSIIAIIVFWLGCNNAAKEIVKEEAIYSRERAVNLGILPYLGSKFLVLGFLSAVQVFLLMVVIYGGLHLAQWGLHALNVVPAERQFVPPAEYVLPYNLQYLALVLLSWTGVAAGLLLSASVSSPDRASVLLPYLLIPQIILCGSMIPLPQGTVPYWLAVLFSPVHWAYRAIHRGARDLPKGWSAHEEYNDSVTLACLALTAQLVVLLVLTVWCLRQKDVGADQSTWLKRLQRNVLDRLPALWGTRPRVLP